MKIIALIPARYAATRFAGKLMQPLGTKTVLQHTYDNTVATNLFDAVYVVTDSDIIYDSITHHGGQAIRSIREHESGSDRIAEAAAAMQVDVVMNIQGDEPFVHKDALQGLVNAFINNKNTQVASLMHIITDPADVHNPNMVKVVVDAGMQALLFSRSPIPYNRDAATPVTYYKHIGIYGYTKAALLHYTQLPMSTLEQVEKLENLRLIEHHIPVQMVLTTYASIGIDTPADLAKAEAYLAAQ